MADPLLQDIAPFIYHGVELTGSDEHRVYDGERDLWQRCLYCGWRVHDGALDAEGGDRRVRCGPGEAVLTEPGMTVRLGIGARANRLTFDIVPRPRIHDRERNRVHFGDDRTPQPRWSAIFGGDLPLPIPDRAQARSCRVIDDCSNGYSYGRQRLRANALLHRWLADLACADDAPTSRGAFAARVEELILEHLRNGVTVTRLAELCDMSRQTLIRKYAAEAGVAPSAAIDRLRLDRAKSALADPGRRDVAHVAGICGFASVTGFGKWFRGRTGATPTAWRREELARGLRVSAGE